MLQVVKKATCRGEGMGDDANHGFLRWCLTCQDGSAADVCHSRRGGGERTFRVLAWRVVYLRYLIIIEGGRLGCPHKSTPLEACVVQEEASCRY